MLKKSSLKVSISGVRGVVGDSLTPEVACNFARAFGAYIGRGSVIVGRDTRPSGVMVQHAVVAGLLSVGCKPVLVGVLPTPTILMNVKEHKALGGIAITASHNPNEWNAMKFVGGDGLFLNKIQAAELLDIYNQGDVHLVANSELRRVVELPRAFELHMKKLRKVIDFDLIRSANLRVAFDCCNGAASAFTQPFLQELGCECYPVFADGSGIFPHGAEPIPENISELSSCVVSNGVDIGFVQDPDADRLAIVDENGMPIGEDYTLTLATDYILAREKPRQTVVANLSVSKSFDDVAIAHGAEFVHTAIGEINVTEEILRRQAIIGGEGNGGVIFPAVHPCRDSFTGMAIVLEAMAKNGASVSDLLRKVNRYVLVKEKFAMSSADSYRLVRMLRKHDWGDEVRMENMDGVRLDWQDCWALIRPSNTESVIRIAAEAKDKRVAKELVQWLWKLCQNLIKKK